MKDRTCAVSVVGNSPDSQAWSPTLHSVDLGSICWMVSLGPDHLFEFPGSPQSWLTRSHGYWVSQAGPTL